MEIILNELSYSTAVSEGEAKSWYDTFFTTCFEIEKGISQKLSIVFSISPINQALHPNFLFLKWLTQLSNEKKTSILSMLTRSPIIHNYPYYKINKLEGKGIGYAYENECVLICFKSHDNWKVKILNATQEQIDEKLDEIIEVKIRIKNCFDQESAKSHYNFLKDKLAEFKNTSLGNITSGIDLWEKRFELFPNLVFCESTSDIMKGWSIESDLFKGLTKRLLQYDSYFSKWAAGDFDLDAVTGNARLESTTRKDKFENELTIICPDGEYRLFTLHCNFGQTGYRIHFFPDTISRKCIIGYIGRKIGT